uniref:F-box domain-containing protein n=1 Tax=Rhabditophanes sp. KR3021 TaxID=114890 RepID=A0AC35TSH9_9BILA
MEKLKREELILAKLTPFSTPPPLPSTSPPKYEPTLPTKKFFHAKDITNNQLSTYKLIPKKSFSYSFDKFELSFAITSPSQSIKNNFDPIPNEVLEMIFNHLDIKERCHLSMTCRRFYHFLTNGLHPITNLAVLNIFQNQVWTEHVSKNNGVKVECLILPESDALFNVLAHCKRVTNVKIWYDNRFFLKSILSRLKESQIMIRCLDIYPYSDDVDTNVVHQYLPNLSGMSMRPHGAEFFWTGLDINEMPSFEGMESLLIENFNLNTKTIFPPSLQSLEWINRNKTKIYQLLPKIKKLKQLKCLLIGHADMVDHGDLNSFAKSLSSKYLPNLQCLTLRFCRIGTNGNASGNGHSQDTLFLHHPLYNFNFDKRYHFEGLRILKLDLCYGVLHFVATFNQRKSTSLKVVWKRERSEPRLAAFSLDLFNAHRDLLKGLKTGFSTKKFCKNNDGERISIWNKTKKSLLIQDYSEGDHHTIMGIVMPLDRQDSPEGDSTTMARSEAAVQSYRVRKVREAAMRTLIKVNVATL